MIMKSSIPTCNQNVHFCWALPVVRVRRFPCLHTAPSSLCATLTTSHTRPSSFHADKKRWRSNFFIPSACLPPACITTYERTRNILVVAVVAVIVGSCWLRGYGAMWQLWGSDVLTPPWFTVVVNQDEIAHLELNMALKRLDSNRRRRQNLIAEERGTYGLILAAAAHSQLWW